ncbi:hypothetical protein M405DRAFT_823498 [Rhizopogon salebrosus TDB-379]|nr:hypothetical protein M405DRAFT_823498 [Rhizopogon salebrosus TDB-379]
MVGMAAVSNLRKFSSGGYRYPNRANLLVLFRMILLSIYTVSITQRQGSVQLGASGDGKLQIPVRWPSARLGS